MNSLLVLVTASAFQLRGVFFSLPCPSEDAMPAAAPKTKEYANACMLILEKFSCGDSLSPFENRSFAIIADELKKSAPEDSLQLRGMLALINDDEDSFNSLFARALLAAQDTTIVHSNYAMALATLGDYDGAAREIQILLKHPVAIFQSNCHGMCLKVCRMIQRYDLAEEILHFVDRLGVVDPSLTPEMLVHLAAQLEDDDPLLLTMLDSWDISTTSGETLQRLESFMTEIGVEHE